MKSKPLLLGHRGCRVPGFEENTLAAIEHALASGCDGIEFDVRHTKDERSVLEHDFFWNRRPISATKYDDLVTREGDRPATLEEVLEQFGDRAFLDIELKVDGNEASIASALHAQPPRSGFMVSSFLPTVLMRIRNNDQSIPLGFIFERSHALELAWSLPVQYLLPRQDLLSKQLIERAHSRGLKIMTWTVNRREDMLRFAGWGVDGLISDDPRLLYQTFHPV